jgi:hypothetical protein
MDPNKARGRKGRTSMGVDPSLPSLGTRAAEATSTSPGHSRRRNRNLGRGRSQDQDQTVLGNISA